ncbi:hypothetical protein [Brevibacterium zhoupengii]|uniref:hypothetical protein n=1 Tax=Brevibacterium zhoupengii TaxID=2898795 RepID=UPI001E4A404A|nr:hypothetical protein [Brevibacterium zhoupengii]
MVVEPPAVERRETLGAYLIPFSVWALAALATVVMWAFAPAHNVNGSCEGIGFGCSPSPRDTIAMFALFFGIPATIGWLGFCAIVTALLNKTMRAKWWVRGLVSLAICLTVSAIAVALILVAG